MRPITERIEPNGPKELGIIDVALVPSHCLGRFIVNAGSHGERVVYKLPIIGMTQAEKEAIEAGDSTPLKEHVEPDKTEPGRFEFINCRGEITVRDDLTDSLVGAVVKSFVEMVPVPHAV